MIGTINVKINSAHPNIQLPTLFAYKNSPSSLRIIDVPKKIGEWKINGVVVTITYPDNEVYSVEATFTAGVWVATLQGSSVAGKVENSYTITASGITESGDGINGYVLGKGDVNILDDDSHVIVGTITNKHALRLSNNLPTNPNVGDVYIEDEYPVMYNGSEWVGFGVTDLSDYQEKLTTSQVAAITKVENDSKTIITFTDNTTREFNWSGVVTRAMLDNADVPAYTIKSIWFGEGVTEIGSQFGYAMNSLVSVHLPNTLTKICSEGFDNRTSLTSINLPESLVEVEDYALGRLLNFTGDLIIPNSLRAWQAQWSECGATRIIIGNGVKHIPGMMFKDSPNLEYVYIPDNVNTIGVGAFSGCTNLTNVDIGDGVETIEEESFVNCTSIETVKFGSGLKKIKNNAFNGCTSLKTVILRDGIEDIGSQAFRNCSAMTTLILPNTLKTIQNHAFFSCSSLTQVIIPASVTNMTIGVFQSCTNLSKVIVMGRTTQAARSFMTLAFLPSGCQVIGCPNDVIGKSEIASVLNGINENSDITTVATALKNLATLCS